MEQSNSKRSAEDDTGDSQDGDDQASVTSESLDIS
jgi:hypothetical protein